MTSDDGERLAEARVSHAHNAKLQQTKAIRTVDDHATDAQDRAMLIAMLGLDDGLTPAGGGRYVGPLN